MIKKMQLRGISRTPSYHLTADGGCSESLNVQLDDTEVSPMLAPLDATPIGAPLGANNYIYIHKFGDNENYLYLDATDQVWKVYAVADSTPPILVFNLQGGDNVVSITSIGKTVIIYGEKNTYYSVWKDNTYLPLGTKIPEPKVYLETSVNTEVVKDAIGLLDTIAGSTEENRLAWGKLTMLASSSWWSKARIAHETKGKYPNSEADGLAQVVLNFSNANAYNYDLVDAATDYVWGKIDEIAVEYREIDYFIAPVFLRYAVKLYDGSYIYQSVPLLIGNGKNKYFRAYGILERGDGDQIASAVFEISKIRAITSISWDTEGWSDIVKSLDLFLSTEIELPRHNTLVWDSWYDSGNQMNHIRFKELNGDNFKDVESELLSKVNFYKVHSFGADELGSVVNYTLKPFSQDELVVKEVLSDDELSNHQYNALGGALSYNMRSILFGVRKRLSPGYNFLQGEVDIMDDPNPETGPRTWKYKFYVSNENGDGGTVLGRNSLDGLAFFNHQSYRPDNYTKPLGVLFYPDPDCRKVEIYDSKSDKYYSVPMKEHPGLNCSYAICSLDSEIISIGTEISVGSQEFESEDPVIDFDNSVMMSNAYNPFVFEMVNRRAFGSRVIGVAPVTKALSTGQFGQFPLYVFTEEGIQSIAINADGSFGVTSFVSRDVAYEGTVAPLDQAVVFSGAQGVMLLVGSDIECISPFMNGRHEILEDEVSAMLAGTVWGDFVDFNDDPFMSFIKDARASYDYAGKRLIFFNPARSYQYVYSLGTKSWHKMLPIIDGSYLHFDRALNSYPECLVSMSGKIFDFSTHLDASLEDDTDPSNDQPVLPGIIETRAFGLEADDMYKTIRRIRIRGNFTKGKVKYLLLASKDGKDFRVIHSLRGPSWKYYKLVIVSQMRPTERISFVEIDYDVKFNDRIR